MKETQEGCLSRSINGFFGRSLFKKAAHSVAKMLFATLYWVGCGAVGPAILKRIGG